MCKILGYTTQVGEIVKISIGSMTLKYFCVEDDDKDKVPDQVSGFQMQKTEEPDEMDDTKSYGSDNETDTIVVDIKMTVSKIVLHTTDVDITVLEVKTTNMTKELADASK